MWRQMSGHCAYPATERTTASGKVEKVGPSYSHEKCGLEGCPCACHLGEEFECANCERPLREAPLIENLDEPGEMVYTHIDPTTGRAIGEECA